MSDRAPRLIETEKLGRSVFSGSLARKTGRPQPVPEAFLVRREDDRISVDRMDHTERAEMMEFAAIRGQERGREFRGRAILTVAHAASNGRTVEAAPLGSNPYHADICLNLPDDGERRELQKQHSVDLAARAVWEEATWSGQPRGFTSR